MATFGTHYETDRGVLRKNTRQANLGSTTLGKRLIFSKINVEKRKFIKINPKQVSLTISKTTYYLFFLIITTTPF